MIEANGKNEELVVRMRDKGLHKEADAYYTRVLKQDECCQRSDVGNKVRFSHFIVMTKISFA